MRSLLWLGVIYIFIYVATECWFVPQGIEARAHQGLVIWQGIGATRGKNWWHHLWHYNHKFYGPFRSSQVKFYLRADLSEKGNIQKLESRNSSHKCSNSPKSNPKYQKALKHPTKPCFPCAPCMLGVLFLRSNCRMLDAWLLWAWCIFLPFSTLKNHHFWKIGF